MDTNTAMDFKNDFKAQISEDTLQPPPPYTGNSTSQVFDVNYIDWSHTISIIDSTNQRLFISKIGGSCSTRLEVMDRNHQIIGYSKSSNLTSKIDVDMKGAAAPGCSFGIHNSASILGGSPQYKSPAFDGTELTWKNKAMSTKIIYNLIDGRGETIAKFESDPKTRVGKLELTDDVTGEEKMNEVAVTLLSLLHRKMRNIQASWIVAVT